MCWGSGGDKNGYAQQNEQAQQHFYNNLTGAFQQEFGDQAELLRSLQNAFNPVLKAGPGQYGFTPGEDAALRASAVDSNASSFANAEKALNNSFAANDETGLPSGAQAQLKEGLAAAGAGQNSATQNQITQAGYNQGLNNFEHAASVLSGTASLMNPTGYAGATVGAGEGVTGAENAFINANKNPWMSVLGAAAGGLTGALTGGRMGG